MYIPFRYYYQRESQDNLKPNIGARVMSALTCLTMYFLPPLPISKREIETETQSQYDKSHL